MEPGYRIPPLKLTLFERWTPRTPAWGWLWRMRERIWGRAKVIDFGARLMDLTGSSESLPTSLPLANPAFTGTNGLRAWLIPEAELAKLRHDLEEEAAPDLLYSPRITTADGMEARLFSGTTIPVDGLQREVGLSLDVLSRVTAQGTDLITVLALSELGTNKTGGMSDGAVSIQTNLALAARFQVPKGSGLFLLEETPGRERRKRLAVIVSVKVPSGKR